MSNEKLYYIQNRGCVGNVMLWWRRECAGYTTDLDDATVVPTAVYVDTVYPINWTNMENL